MKPIICLNDISFSYDKVPILEHISIDIDEQDFVAIIGPNGAGKTTLVKLILGMLHANTGTVEVFDKNIEKFDAWNLIGYIPQKTDIDRNFPGNVREILLLKQEKINKNITELLEIEKILNERFSELSGGQQQKVLIALALSTNPRLLILDEPTVGVDLRSLDSFFNILKKLNKEMKVTIVLVTHEVGVIQKFVNNIICINRNFSCRGSPEKIGHMLKQVYGSSFGIHTHGE